MAVPEFVQQSGSELAEFRKVIGGIPAKFEEEKKRRPKLGLITVEGCIRVDYGMCVVNEMTEDWEWERRCLEPELRCARTGQDGVKS